MASKIAPGEIIALYGDLGSGKTTFTQGLAEAFGVRSHVTSPTFVIMKVYETSNAAVKKVYHLDSYRLGTKDDAESIGLRDVLSQKDGVTLIEWPEKIEDELPGGAKKITFQYLSGDKRKITSNDY